MKVSESMDASLHTSNSQGAGGLPTSQAGGGAYPFRQGKFYGKRESIAKSDPPPKKRRTAAAAHELGNFALPSAMVARLDRYGVVSGKTWRDMPGKGGASSRGGYNPTLMALCWWLWKKGILNLKDAEADADAALDWESEVDA